MTGDVALIMTACTLPGTGRGAGAVMRIAADVNMKRLAKCRGEDKWVHGA